MLEHLGFNDLGSRLHKALDICGQSERKVVMTGCGTGATTSEFGDYVMATVEDPKVETRWKDARASGARPS